jgi:excisionase family DNA binding protein
MEESDLVAEWHLLSIREIATACQLSEKAVRRAIDEGELTAVKLRSRLRVTPQDFEDWISASRRTKRQSPPQPRRRAPTRPAAGTFRALVQSEVEL